MVDYLVVGLGLAGISFCEMLEAHGKSFLVISDQSQASSIVAGGLYNPVILKRFTPVWQAGEQLDEALPFYGAIEKKLGVQLDYKLRVLRRFASVEEQNMWFEASDKSSLRPFMAASIVSNANSRLDAPFGFGEVLHTGRIDTAQLIASYTAYLQDKTLLRQETFHFESLSMGNDYAQYKGINAKRVVFATGFGLRKNPFFNYLPLQGSKGELLTIKAVDFKETSVIKASVFSIPLGGDVYRVGATYQWQDKSQEITENARVELLQKLDTIIRCDYTVIDQVAGVRPTVSDRRPLVGQHPKYHELFVLNGFGSRGVMIAPYAARQLYNAIENKQPIHPEMDIARFKKKFPSA